MLGALAGGLHAAALTAFIGWRFRDHILAPPLAGRVQLFDPASKLLGLIQGLPGDFLHQFYGPGFVAKVPLAIDLIAANLLLGAILGLVLGVGTLWWPRVRAGWPRSGGGTERVRQS